MLHGEDDPFFPIGNGEALAAEIPDARLVRLGRAGHRLRVHAIPIVAKELIAHGGLTGPARRLSAHPRRVGDSTHTPQSTCNTASRQLVTSTG